MNEVAASKQRVLITGGAGFIGSNLAESWLQRGARVLVLDNLSRKGTQANLEWLRGLHGGQLDFEELDIRDGDALARAIHTFDPDVALHQAGQVAVTTSVVQPRLDFEVNALGTFNLLEALRSHRRPVPLLFSSTNKVYGKLDGLGWRERATRYDFRGEEVSVTEEQPLDFYSPYGCSKGASDQYVRDYARIYRMPNVVLRQSCIYGPRQFGVEDQGWVAWFLIATLSGRRITVYGDGKQVRDLLHVQDLIAAYDVILNRIDAAAGQVYNLGGGRERSLSLLELLAWLKSNLQLQITPDFTDWRPGDQKVYLSSIDKLKRDLNWQPEITVEEGLRSLSGWISENLAAINELLAAQG